MKISCLLLLHKNIFDIQTKDCNSNVFDNSHNISLSEVIEDVQL
jgi:hypothetical protein